MSDPKLFSPDTLHQELHDAFKWAVRRGSYTMTAKVAIKQLRKRHPQVYMDLASMAHEGRWKHGNSYMFRLGVRIFFSMLKEQSTNENSDG